MRYYQLDDILEKNAHYNFIIGERSNGKTTAALRHIVSDYYNRGKKGAIVRQMEMDIKGHRGASLFNGMIDGGMISELTEGEFQTVKYYNRAYYLGGENNEGEIVWESEPFAHIFAVSQAIHYKSNSYPNVGTIVFDEFMRQDHVYLVDEVVQFLNLVSTIVREKDHAKIFLIANTVSWNSPYFEKFGLKGVSKMKPGDMGDVEYKRVRPSGEEIAMKVAIEYCENTFEYGGKASDVYFVIDDERVNMITDGGFAIPDYPPCPYAFTTKDVKLTTWIIGEHGILRARLIRVNRDTFFFVEKFQRYEKHDGETVGTMRPDWDRYEALKDDRRDIFYSLDFSAKRNHFVSPAMSYADERTHYFAHAIRANRLFFDSNESGEDLIYYIKQSTDRSILNI